MAKRALFIDRDGTLVVEPLVDCQLDSLEKLEFIPGVFRNLHFIREKLDFELVIVTNQDGLGTTSFPEDTFWPAHKKILQAFKMKMLYLMMFLLTVLSLKIIYQPGSLGVGMLGRYLKGDYDLMHSYVIGDRITDMQLAQNLGCKGILFAISEEGEQKIEESGLSDTCVLITNSWDRITEFLFAGERRTEIVRKHRRPIFI